MAHIIIFKYLLSGKMKATSYWLHGLATANTEGDKLPIFVDFMDQGMHITPEIQCQPHYLETPLSQTIS